MTRSQSNHIMQRVLNGALYLITTMLMLSVFYAGPRVEVLLYPVVSGFSISRVWEQNDHIMIEGVGYKNRGECVPIALTMEVYGTPGSENSKFVLIDTDLNDPQSGVTLRYRSEGPVIWGPWKLTPPLPPLGPLTRISVSYDCHALWHTTQIVFEGHTADIFPPEMINGV